MDRWTENSAKFVVGLFFIFLGGVCSPQVPAVLGNINEKLSGFSTEVTQGQEITAVMCVGADYRHWGIRVFICTHCMYGQSLFKNHCGISCWSRFIHIWKEFEICKIPASYCSHGLPVLHCTNPCLVLTDIRSKAFIPGTVWSGTIDPWSEMFSKYS